MLTPEILADYLDGLMPAERRAALEAACAEEPDAFRELADQVQLDAALRVVFDARENHERVKRSILAVVGGASHGEMKSRVILATHPSEKIARFPVRRIAAWAGLAAAACIALLLWFTADSRVAHLVGAAGNVAVMRDGREMLPWKNFPLRGGDDLRVNDRATLTYSDGTRLDLAPNSHLKIVSASHAPLADSSKRLLLNDGEISAEISKQPPSHPFVIETPHAQLTVVGTRFSLRTDSEKTRLDVTEGAVRFNGGGGEVLVRAGEFAVAAPGVVPRVASSRRQGNKRDPWQWPFSPASPWNRPLGDGAHFEPVDFPNAQVPSFPIGIRWRTILVAEPPVRTRPVFLDGKHVADFSLPRHIEEKRFDDDVLCVVDSQRQAAAELSRLTPGPQEGIAVRRFVKVDVRGSGVAPDGAGLGEYGGAAMAGVVRRGELAAGVRHAIAIAFNRAALNRAGADGRPFVWPASAASPDASAKFSGRGNVFIGSLLAIPPGVDITKLGFGDSGPAFELARALQDYGAYVVANCEWQRMHFYISDNEAPKEALDFALERLASELRVVTNNTPQTPGGGGKPRREPAPDIVE